MLNNEFMSVAINSVIFVSLSLYLIHCIISKMVVRALVLISFILLQYMLLFGCLLKNEEIILKDRIVNVSRSVILDSRSREYKNYIYHIETIDNGYKYYQDEIEIIKSEKNTIEVYRYSSKIPMLNHRIFTQIRTKVYTDKL